MVSINNAVVAIALASSASAFYIPFFHDSSSSASDYSSAVPSSAPTGIPSFNSTQAPATTSGNFTEPIQGFNGTSDFNKRAFNESSQFPSHANAQPPMNQTSIVEEKANNGTAPLPINKRGFPSQNKANDTAPFAHSGFSSVYFSQSEGTTFIIPSESPYSDSAFAEATNSAPAPEGTAAPSAPSVAGFSGSATPSDAPRVPMNETSNY